MMRTWLWTLLLAIVAVALAVMLREHAGNVLVLAPPWRIELSVTLAVLLLIALFVAMYAVLRLLAWLIAIPERVRAWRGRRAQERDQELIERGWIGLLEGRYAHAEKDMGKLYIQTKVGRRRVLAALSSARAAHQMGEYDRRDQLIDDARASAGDDVRLQEAVASVAADLLLEQGQAQRALEALEPLQDGGARHLRTLHLLLRAEKALDHHERVFTLARTLLRRHFLGKSEAMALIDHAGAARLRAGVVSGDGWRAIWKEMKAEERQLPGIAMAAAAAYEAAGDGAEAGRILENAINVDFNPTLVAVYSRCDAEQVPRRLATAETWLQQRPDDANLLTALGMLCLSGMLWGQAERYLQRSLARRDDPQCHALLGILYDRLNRPEDAARHWRQASAAVAALPVLAVDTALPAADTGADPSRLDAEGEYSAWSPESAPAPAAPAKQAEPVEPPAVDYVIDADEDYYDSAPIPPNPSTDSKKG